MIKQLLLFIYIVVQHQIFAQPTGMENYNIYPGDTTVKLGVRTLLLEGVDSKQVYLYINEISEEGIGNTILELMRILDECNVDPTQPATIESNFPEHIDNFDAKEIARLLSKKKKDFSFTYFLKDKNDENETIWMLTYKVDSNNASLKCIRK